MFLLTLMLFVQYVFFRSPLVLRGVQLDLKSGVSCKSGDLK